MPGEGYLSIKKHYTVFKHQLRWTVIIVPVAVVIGSMVAFFLSLLSWAIHFRFAHPWLLYLLPVAGTAIYFSYQLYGKNSEKGNNLIIDEIHEPGGGVPKRMTPLVLLTTVITHLFGGSAGREGTAVQMGGSIAQFFGLWFKLNAVDTGIILTAGIAAGFGAVFGTPLAGAIFAIEVLTQGRIQYAALIPCLVAGIVADITVSAWGIHHTAYHIGVVPAGSALFTPYMHIDVLLLIKVVIASVAFGLASMLFAETVHGVKNIFNKYIFPKWAIPALGGLIIIALTFIIGKPDYLSLGVDAEYSGAVTIPSAFNAGGADTWSWLWKTVYTTITLGSGFKGGEVTPLFFIGSTLGNTLSSLLNAPVSLFAALGFIAVFAGATNTPLASTFMGIELFGSEYALFFAVACFTAYFFSGDSGIYSSQRIAVPKIFDDASSIESIAEAEQKRQNYMRRRIARYKIAKKK
ncbi:voltage-gated chloride channel family protein [Mucilaginibacter sp. UR6-11]|uniref:voltage-gated chloride channel family protein n=1 Tax=Mucilaginibacter sp. UR6-11 TaxID=1435644 RepID=UPI001E313101|nr:voltage-gated chloride channel family protein [Mucilaginibacter sp. UR6-11]MCC8424839.1 voltage-gated chloride channel family protein [Mucilaginibacter sp. UR6-11]